MMMVTQYFDMLRDIGVSSRASSVFLPHTPGGPCIKFMLAGCFTLG